MRAPTFLLAFCVVAVVCFLGCDAVKVADSAESEGTTLEVAVFEGGFGIDWHKKIARQYGELDPSKNISVNLWGDPRVDEKIKPRILRRSPPEAADCTLPLWKLILAGKLYPLDEFLDSPAWDQPGTTWRETLIPGVLDSYTYKGQVYGVSLVFSAWVIWYDERQFREHGWEVPSTWSELESLCEQIEADGVAPFAFQGKYPTYAWSTYLTLLHRLGGTEAFRRTQDIEKGAFLQPEAVEAARMVQDLARDHFQRGAMAMTHTESQMEFVNNRAAMVACGLWLENEMREATPPEFEMACFPFPAVEGGKGDPTAAYGGGGHLWTVFSDAKHPREVCQFLKYMFSKENARDFSRTLGTLTTVKGATGREDMSPTLASALDIVENANEFFLDRLTLLYLEWTNETMSTGIARLVQQEISPEEFCRLLEDGLDKVRNDPNIYKPPPI